MASSGCSQGQQLHSLSSPPEGHHHCGTLSQDGNLPLSLPIASRPPLALVASRHQPLPLPSMVGCCMLCPLRGCHPLSLIVACHCVIDHQRALCQPPTVGANVKQPTDNGDAADDSGEESMLRNGFICRGGGGKLADTGWNQISSKKAKNVQKNV
jgi:hypothetical protein